jgi:ATP-binding cassette subfamily B protein
MTSAQKKRGRKTNPRTMKRVIQAFSPYRSEVITILIAILITSLLDLAPSILISNIFDDAIGKGDGMLLLIYVIIMTAAIILSGIIGLGQSYLSNKVGQNVMYNFRNQLYQHLQNMPLSFFTGTRTGEIQSRLSNDISGVQGTVTNTATSLVSDIAILASTIIAMIVLSPVLTLITLVMFPLSGWVSYQVGKIRRRMSKETQESLASLTAQMEETLSVSGILLVKVFGQQKHTQTQFQQQNKILADLTLRQLIIGRLLWVVTGTVFSLMPILVYLVAGEQIVNHLPVLGGIMTLGTIVAFTTLQFRLFFPIGELTNLQVEIQGSLALFDRIFEYLDLPITIQDKPDALHLPPAKVRGEATFRNVSFTYKPDEYSVLTDTSPDTSTEEMPDDDPAPANPDAFPLSTRTGASPVPTMEEPRQTLKNISFTIKPGQLAALVGPSGAGKTTITYLLPRLYDVDSGEIEIDGINVKDIALTSLGELIGVVTQETYLFHASIRENLLYARRDATEEEMIAAAQAAAIHDRIMELEKGYDTLVGERGYKLSGGEKQRVAIARVILKNPRLLILDEATSALDTRSERLIQTALETLMKGRTTLAIAHRLSTILAADVILVVNKGEIVERGTHRELLALGGLYAQLYHEQFSQPSVESDLAIIGTGSAQGTTIRSTPVRKERQTLPVFETQISYLQPSEVTLQEKTASPTRKLPIRRASKADLHSTTYLLPSVREVFVPNKGNEQATALLHVREGQATFTQNSRPVVSYTPPISSFSRVRLKKYSLALGDADAEASVPDRNALATPSHAPHKTPDGDSSLKERQNVTLIKDPMPLKGIYNTEKWLNWDTDQEDSSLATSNQRIVMDVHSITKTLPLGRERLEILKGISFQIHRGEFVAIVGPSGSGKSTLLGIIAGLDQPTSGQVLIDGVDIAHLSERDLAKVRNEKIGMVFQAFNLIPTLTALENVVAPLQVGKRKGPHTERAKELLTLVGLGHRLHHRPSQLSGGEQQRIAIARALATDPPIVIADEPTGNLDARNGANVLELIASLRAQTGKTFIIATHDQNVAAHADRAIRIVDGLVAALDTTGGRITQ